MELDSRQEFINSQFDLGFDRSFNSSSERKQGNSFDPNPLKRSASEIQYRDSDQVNFLSLNNSQENEPHSLNKNSTPSEFLSTDGGSINSYKIRLENMTNLLQSSIVDKTTQKVLYHENAKNREELARMNGQSFDKEAYIEEQKNNTSNKTLALIDYDKYKKLNKLVIREMKQLQKSRKHFTEKSQDMNRKRQNSPSVDKEIQVLRLENQEFRKKFTEYHAQVERTYETFKRIELAESSNIFKTPSSSWSQSSIYKIEDLNEIRQDINLLKQLTNSMREHQVRNRQEIQGPQVTNHQDYNFNHHRDSIMRNHGILQESDAPTRCQIKSCEIQAIILL